MTKAWLDGFWQLGLVTLITGSAITSSKTFVLAQIQPDSTLGSESSIVNSVDTNSDRIDGGAIRSTNLFHSFQEFNVGEGKAVNFANPQGIENILSRVTGNNISEIRGVLGVLGSANLFLLNPNGIIFGENASLNVNGSFVATTANELQFGTQGIFSATNPETPSLLTVNPSALLFNQINQNAAIANNSQAPAGQDPGGVNVFGLRVPDGKSLLLIGGNVSMDGGWAIASGGRIELGGLTEAGSIGIQSDGNQFSLSFPEGVERGDISLNNKAKVDVSGKGGGSIAANARNLEILAGSRFFAGIGEGLGTANTQAGDITINTRNLIVRDSQLGTSVYGEGNAGDFKIIASDSVELSGEIPGNRFAGGILATIGVTGKGKSGNIYLETRRLSVSDGSKVQVATFGEGDAGSLLIRADEIEVFETEKPNFYSTGIFATVGFDPSAVKPSKGNGGNLTIETRNLSIRNGGNIGVDTQGEGNGGQLVIKASDSIEVTGNLPYNSEISAGITDDRGAGNGGSITIETPKLTVKDGGIITSSTLGQGNAGTIDIITNLLTAINGGQINSFTRGQGNAGDITIQARDAITFDGVSNNGFPSALFSYVDTAGVGDGGNLTINTDNLSLRDGALINSSTFGRGNSGNISITADNSIFLDASSYIVNSVQDINAVGNAGKIDITTGSLSATNGSQINSFTRGQGNAGDITIQATDTVTFDGFDINNNYSSSSSSVEAGANGDGGNINVTARSLSLTNGGEVNVSVRGASDSLPGGRGEGGSVNINVRDALIIAGGNRPGIFASLGADAVGSGGDINIQAGNLVAKDSGQITSSTFGEGDAGNIDIDANSIVLNGSDVGIFSGATQEDRLPGTLGNGGDINITADSLSIYEGARISANTEILGTAGNITVDANQITLNNRSSITSESVADDELIASNDGLGNAGNINLTVRDLEANNSDISTSSSQSSGGAIAINARNIRLRGDSDIRTNVASGAGSGGDITLTADSIIAFDDSDIFAFAQDGQGGNITLNTPAYFGNGFTTNSFNTNPDILDNNDRADINATGAVSGVVTIPDVSFLQNSLTELPENIIDTNALVANSCIARSSDRGGTFTITGRGNLPSRPGDAAVSPYPTGDVRGVESDSTSTRRPWKIGDPIVEPQAAYRLANGQIILSRECDKWL